MILLILMLLRAHIRQLTRPHLLLFLSCFLGIQRFLMHYEV